MKAEHPRVSRTCRHSRSKTVPGARPSQRTRRAGAKSCKSNWPRSRRSVPWRQGTDRRPDERPSQATSGVHTLNGPQGMWADRALAGLSAVASSY